MKRIGKLDVSSFLSLEILLFDTQLKDYLFLHMTTKPRVSYIAHGLCGHAAYGGKKERREPAELRSCHCFLGRSALQTVDKACARMYSRLQSTAHNHTHVPALPAKAATRLSATSPLVCEHVNPALVSSPGGSPQLAPSRLRVVIVWGGELCYHVWD